MTADDVRSLIEQHGRHMAGGVFVTGENIAALSEAIMEALRGQRHTDQSWPVEKLNASNGR